MWKLGQDLLAQHARRVANNSSKLPPPCANLTFSRPCILKSCELKVATALGTMSNDSIALLAQRLQALQEEGIKINPATANPGECLQQPWTVV